MCLENLHAPLQTARINETKANIDQVSKELEREGFKVEKSRSIPIAIQSISGNLAKSKAFKNGFMTIQDESSMIVGYVVAPKSDECILDACAAPGGKTTHMAELMKTQEKSYR